MRFTLTLLACQLATNMWLSFLAQRAVTFLISNFFFDIKCMCHELECVVLYYL